MARRKTAAINLLLITDHEFSDIEADGATIHVRPAYEWTIGSDLAELEENM